MHSALYKRTLFYVCSGLQHIQMRLCVYVCIVRGMKWKRESVVSNGPDWNCLGLIKRDMCGIACICAATATATATPTAASTIGGGTRLQVWIEWRSGESVSGDCANQCSIIDKLPDASVHYAGIASVDAFMKFMHCTRRRSAWLCAANLIYDPDPRERESERGGESGVPPSTCWVRNMYLFAQKSLDK